jgi:hypothetical protein
LSIWLYLPDSLEKTIRPRKKMNTLQLGSYSLYWLGLELWIPYSGGFYSGLVPRISNFSENGKWLF